MLYVFLGFFFKKLPNMDFSLILVKIANHKWKYHVLVSIKQIVKQIKQIQVFYFSIYALENKPHGAQVEYLKSSTTYIMINKKHRCIDAKNTSNFKTL